MDFSKAKSTYRKNAVIQKQMAQKLICQIAKFFGAGFEKIFEIGAGTGFLTDEIKERLNFKELILNDITDNYTGFKPSEYIKGDITKIKLPEKCSLIASNAVFQWISDYEPLFKKLYFALSEKGALCFSTFGEKNFNQIKDITGIGLDYPNLKEIVQKSGFEILYYEEELQTMYFKTIKEVLTHIKLTGVKTQNKVWTKADFKQFEEKYLKKYKDDMGFELTYHPCFYILKKH